jgi:hypothetical protein
MKPSNPDDIQSHLPDLPPAEIQAHAPLPCNDDPTVLPDYNFKLHSSWGSKESSRLRLGLVLAVVAPFVLETYFIRLTRNMDRYDTNWDWGLGAICMLVGITGMSILPVHPMVRFLLALLYLPVMEVCLMLYGLHFIMSVYNVYF